MSDVQFVAYDVCIHRSPSLSRIIVEMHEHRGNVVAQMTDGPVGHVGQWMCGDNKAYSTH